MKIVRESLGQLFEIGEGTSKPYEITKISDYEPHIIYSFSTEDDDKYIVDFVEYEIDSYAIVFSRESDKHEWSPYRDSIASTDVVTNRGRQFRIMSTIIKCIRKTADEHNIKEFYFSPAKSKPDDRRREFMYLKYVEKNLPDNYTMYRDNESENMPVFIMKNLKYKKD